MQHGRGPYAVLSVLVRREGTGSAVLLIRDVFTRVNPERVDVDGLIQWIRIGRELLTADLAGQVADPRFVVTVPHSVTCIST